MLLLGLYVTVSLGMYLVYLGMDRLNEYLGSRERYKKCCDFCAVSLLCIPGVMLRMPILALLIPSVSTVLIYRKRLGDSFELYRKVMLFTALVAGYTLLVSYYLQALNEYQISRSRQEIPVMCMLCTCFFQLWIIHVQNAWHFRREKWGGYYLIGSIRPVVVSIWIYELFKQAETTEKKTILSLLFWGIILLEFYLCYYFVRIRDHEIEHKKRIETPHNREEYYLAMEEEHLKIRRMYHDMQNQLMILQETGEKSAKDLSWYLEETTEMLNEVGQFYHTGSQKLDIFLYESKKRAKEKGISFNVSIQDNCLDFMKESDLMTIFVNAIANALEACAKIEEGEKKIDIVAGSLHSDVILTIVNTKKIGSTYSRLVTTKTDKIRHGIGLMNIQRAVNHYDGYMTVEDGKDTFRLSILMMKEEK